MSAQPIAQLSIDTAFDHALAGATARDSAALVPVARVAYGQPFIRDSAPHELLVRATQVAFVEDDDIAVVVIAADRFDPHDPPPIGRVFAINRKHTVRLVDVLRPLKTEARR
jgi:hypothetical protein